MSIEEPIRQRRSISATGMPAPKLALQRTSSRSSEDRASSVHDFDNFEELSPAFLSNARKSLKPVSPADIASMLQQQAPKPISKSGANQSHKPKAIESPRKVALPVRISLRDTSGLKADARSPSRMIPLEGAGWQGLAQQMHSGWTQAEEFEEILQASRMLEHYKPPPVMMREISEKASQLAPNRPDFDKLEEIDRTVVKLLVDLRGHIDTLTDFKREIDRAKARFLVDRY